MNYEEVMQRFAKFNLRERAMESIQGAFENREDVLSEKIKELKGINKNLSKYILDIKAFISGNKQLDRISILIIGILLQDGKSDVEANINKLLQVYSYPMLSARNAIDAIFIYAYRKRMTVDEWNGMLQRNRILINELIIRDVEPHDMTVGGLFDWVKKWETEDNKTVNYTQEVLYSNLEKIISSSDDDGIEGYLKALLQDENLIYYRRKSTLYFNKMIYRAIENVMNDLSTFSVEELGITERTFGNYLENNRVYLSESKQRGAQGNGNKKKLWTILTETELPNKNEIFECIKDLKICYEAYSQNFSVFFDLMDRNPGMYYVLNDIFDFDLEDLNGNEDWRANSFDDEFDDEETTAVWTQLIDDFSDVKGKRLDVLEERVRGQIELHVINQSDRQDMSNSREEIVKKARAEAITVWQALLSEIKTRRPYSIDGKKIPEMQYARYAYMKHLYILLREQSKKIYMNRDTRRKNFIALAKGELLPSREFFLYFALFMKENKKYLNEHILLGSGFGMLNLNDPIDCLISDMFSEDLMQKHVNSIETRKIDRTVVSEKDGDSTYKYVPEHYDAYQTNSQGYYQYLDQFQWLQEAGIKDDELKIYKVAENLYISDAEKSLVKL